VRYLILSDIHANWEALEAVLEQVAGLYDRALCCGDLVGYSADPNKVVGWVRRNISVTVRGNHDKVCAGLEGSEWFNPVAQVAARWTREELTAENLAYLRGLPKGPAEVEEFQILHGSPLDEDGYVMGTHDAASLSGYLGCPLSFFGHTHIQGGFLWIRGSVRQIAGLKPDERRQALPLEPEPVYLINPGSVGQPRDGDPRAAYALYATEERSVTYCRAPYDIGEAQRKMRLAGLPPSLADRLATGR
jgi:predicted phosphodiesterase